MNLQHTKAACLVCWCLIALLVLWTTTSFSNDSKSFSLMKSLKHLEKRFADFKEESSQEEVLLILSDAETVCRMIAVLDISEEGVADHSLGQFVSILLEKHRWDVLYKVLEKHYYYPQTTGWILNYMWAESDPKLDELIQGYHSDQEKVDATMREMIETLKEKKAKE